MGWIKLDRSILENPIWKKKPYSEGQAWVDMLLMANHKDNKLLIDGNIILIQRGQFLTSILNLSERWGWDRRKTSKFLNILESDSMIAQKRTTHGTTVTIVKYGVYQDVGTTDGTTVCTTDVQRYVQPMYTNKNIKKEKKEKNNKFCQFEKADYDFEQLERELLSN